MTKKQSTREKIHQQWWEEKQKKGKKGRKSYSHKPHLGSLPHDRRTNDPELLQERIDEIDRRVEKIDKDIQDLMGETNKLIEEKNELEDITKREQEIHDLANQSHDAANKFLNEWKEKSIPDRKNIRDGFKEIHDMWGDIMENQPMNTIQGYDIEENFNKLFGKDEYFNTGLLTSDEQAEYIKLADEIDRQLVWWDHENYPYKGGDEFEAYGDDIRGFADQIRTYASDYELYDKGLLDKVNPYDLKIYELKKESPYKYNGMTTYLENRERKAQIAENNSRLENLDKDISRNRKEYEKLDRVRNDYINERQKTEEKMG